MITSGIAVIKVTGKVLLVNVTSNPSAQHHYFTPLLEQLFVPALFLHCLCPNYDMMFDFFIFIYLFHFKASPPKNGTGARHH